MPVFSKITTALSAVLALTSTVVHAAPLQPAPAIHDYKPSTHRRTFGPNNVEFVSYHPRSSYQTFHNGDHSLLSRSANATHPFTPRAATTTSGVSPDVENAAVSYLSEQTGIPKDSLRVHSGFTNDIGTTHCYLTQYLNGIPVTNGVANISFDKAGKVVAFGSNMVNPTLISSPTPSLSQSSAIRAAERALGLTRLGSVPVTLSYVLQPDPTDSNGKWALLTHQFQLQNADISKWVQAHVDATNAKTGNVVHVVDFVADAAYRVLPWINQDPREVKDELVLVTDPQNLAASPKGWHTVDNVEYPETKGNNVFSYYQMQVAGMDAVRVGSQQTWPPGQVYDYKWSPDKAPNATDSHNLDVGRVNAFYVANTYHDVLYEYGFTEKSFNFQTYNYEKGGKGNDAIEMQVQAPGENNAYFATPPDGQAGHCGMFPWTLTTPNRDGDLSNDIITHELTHGLTNRMTGGGTGACLGTTEAGGMGEGWSDTVAFWSEQSSATEKPFTLGSWVVNNTAGIRSHPYSTNFTINPLTYGYLTERKEVHDIGEVWATILVEVYWALVGKYGFSSAIADPSKNEGNIKFLRLLVDALPLQPCNPTFIQARDAIIQADANRYQGTNKCLLWKAFAKRGLGLGAGLASAYADNGDVPQDC